MSKDFLSICDPNDWIVAGFSVRGIARGWLPNRPWFQDRQNELEKLGRNMSDFHRYGWISLYMEDAR